MGYFIKPVTITFSILVLGYLMLMMINIDTHALGGALSSFSSICRENPVLSYVIYSTALCTVLVAGIPAATALMLLAGLLYNFWEAAVLITSCRLGVAVMSYSLCKNHEAENCAKPGFVNKIESHPYISLLLMRLAPVPDSMINYSMGRIGVKTQGYALISFIGMVPATLMMIAAGNELGSIGEFINYIK